MKPGKAIFAVTRFFFNKQDIFNVQVLTIICLPLQFAKDDDSEHPYSLCS